MNINLLRAAEDDLYEASLYYEERAKNLGVEFLEIVNCTLKKIADAPDAWPEIRANIKRCIIRRFPYAVYYAVEADSIQVIAIMHLRQHPRRWFDRATS